MAQRNETGRNRAVKEGLFQEVTLGLRQERESRENEIPGRGHSKYKS